MRAKSDQCEKKTYEDDLEEDVDTSLNLDAEKRGLDVNSGDNLSAGFDVSDDSGDGTGRVNMAV